MNDKFSNKGLMKDGSFQRKHTAIGMAVMRAMLTYQFLGAMAPPTQPETERFVAPLH